MFWEELVAENTLVRMFSGGLIWIGSGRYGFEALEVSFLLSSAAKSRAELAA